MINNGVGDREWVFWIRNTNYPNEDKPRFLCVIRQGGFQVESDPPLYIEIKDIKRCVPEPATSRPFRTLIRLELFSRDLPLTLWVLNPTNPFSYGADGYAPESTHFIDVVYSLSQGISPVNVHSNPYIRELSRKEKNVPAIVFSNKYLSPSEYLEATKRPMSHKEKLMGFLIILVGFGVVIAMAVLAGFSSN